MRSNNSALACILPQLLLVLYWGIIGASSCVGYNNSEENYCTAWRINVEMNINVRAWQTVPKRCVPYIKSYMRCGQYNMDFEAVIGESIAYLNNLSLVGDGKDAWVFDIDETSLSNIHLYAEYDYGGMRPNILSALIWVLQAKSPALEPTLSLYNKLIARGVKVFFITGRNRLLAGATVKNLSKAGYKGWAGIIYKDGIYGLTSAEKYKSALREKLVNEDGYRIWGNVGDQWSDISGTDVGSRTFKLPNPMYFVA